MPDWAGALLSAVVTGSAVLAGVLVTQRHQRKLAANDRAEKRRDDQRRVLGEVLATAWDSHDRFRDLLPALRGLGDLSERELREFAATDRVGRLGDISIRLNRVLIEAYLLVGDAGLRRATVGLREVNARFKSVLSEASNAADPTLLEPAFVLLEEFREALLGLERAASERLPIPVDHGRDDAR